MKRITVLLMSLALAVCFSLTALASEAEEIPTHEAESPAEPEISAPVPEDTPEIEGGEEPEKFYSEWIDRITDTSMWINIGTVLLSVIGIFAMLKKKFGDVSALIRGKADGKTVADAIVSSAGEIKQELSRELQRVEAQLSEYEDNEKKMWAIITIFMTHAKISPSVKVEIMNRLTGIKDMSGTLEEIVENAENSIKAAEAEAKSETPETPALDRVLSETPDFMSLG